MGAVRLLTQRRAQFRVAAFAQHRNAEQQRDGFVVSIAIKIAGQDEILDQTDGGTRGTPRHEGFALPMAVLQRYGLREKAV